MNKGPRHLYIVKKQNEPLIDGPITRLDLWSHFPPVPKTKIAICPNVGWFKDFYDPQTMLDPTFKGTSILPENNSNWPQLDNPAISTAFVFLEPFPVGLLVTLISAAILRKR